jgi:hypothetical protein
MSTTYIIREPVDAAPIAARSTSRLSDSPGSTSLAELLAEVGMAIEALPTTLITSRSAGIAALTAHLVDGARAASANGDVDGGRGRSVSGGRSGAGFTPSRETPATLSLRTLGRLATRTAGHDVQLDATRATRVRTLLTELTHS